MEDDNNNLFFRDSSRLKEGSSNNFIIDFARYFLIRILQLYRIASVSVFILIDFFTNLKSIIVRRMYWGRTSFYRTAFQLIVIFVTIGALVASIGTRTDLLAKEEEGVLASSGIIGNNDIFLQVGTAESITEAQVSEVDYTISKYTVKAGDTLSTIAKAYGVSADTVRWANGIPAGRDTLSVGQVLDIPPMNGVLYTVAKGDNLDKIISKVKDANKFDLIELNNLQGPDYVVSVGQKLFIPDATYKPIVVATTQRSGGSASYVNVVNTAVNVAPGTFVNPMQQCPGYKFARGWRYSHTGVDLSHPAGCWISAAGSGTILKAGWCGGSMGFCTVIRHDNGYSTLYLHGQGQFAVQSGQRVAAGQSIMTLGNTGYSFGAHLHLSMSAPGVDVVNNYHGRINPAGVIPY